MLLQCYIFISVVYVCVCVYMCVFVCLRPRPYRAVLSWHGLNGNREGTAASVHGRCLPCVSLWLLALAAALFIFSRDV